MTGEQFFSRLTELMIDNPPSAADAPALAAFAQLGLIPGAPWTPDSLSPQVRAAIAAAPAAGMAALKQAHAAEQADTVNGWSWPRGLGAYGTDYGRRALVANVGLGANLDADALYPNAYRDGEGQPLSGEHRYLLRFEAGELPPVNGFWSLSLYNHKQAFADNPIDRYAIGDRDHLLHGADGSLTLYIQHDEPTGDRKANWLPAPAEPFNLYLRLFWPREEAEDGTWQIPPVHRTE
jgi:hypothetical protein